jgi:hypothetical protein
MPSPDLTFNLSNLADSAQLKSLLVDKALPSFRFAAAAARHWNDPVQQLPAGMKLVFNVTENAQWQTSTGISFALPGSVECDLEIVPSGGVIEYLDGLDATANSALPQGDYVGSVYVKLSLNFSIAAQVSGGGAVGALGISGNAEASAGQSFVFAHKVGGGTLLRDAIHESLANFVFPFEPSCATAMSPGDLAEVTFHGSLSYGLQISYGLDSYQFSAPSVATALDSRTKGIASLTVPSVAVDIGANASIGCTHGDDFTAIVQKLDDNHAFLYLMRAHKTDVSAGASFGAQVSISASYALYLDKEKLQETVNGVTAGLGGAKVAQVADELQEKLGGRINGWVSSVVQNGAQVSAAWDRQSSTTMIAKYHIALDNPALGQSWKDFCIGNLQSAVQAGGLTLDPGSGTSRQISRSFTVGITFFNFFNAQNVSSYFEKSEVVVTDTGNLHYLFDVGEERETTINQVLQKTRIHFVADAMANQAADVDLRIELSETRKQDEARHMIAIPAYLPAGSQAAAATGDMQQFVGAHPAGTLNLNFVLKSSAYGLLTSSPYDGNKPPRDQAVDAHNWRVFHDAAVSLLGLNYAARLTYPMWQTWNEAANGSKVADRRHLGNWDGTDASTVWEGQSSDVQLRMNYFCAATSSFMNLCDDLHKLAQLVSTAKIPEDWNRLLNDLKDIVTRDVKTDFAKPAVAALLTLCAAKQVNYDKQFSTDALTCTITLT